MFARMRLRSIGETVRRAMPFAFARSHVATLSNSHSLLGKFAMLAISRAGVRFVAFSVLMLVAPSSWRRMTRPFAPMLLGVRIRRRGQQDPLGSTPQGRRSGKDRAPQRRNPRRQRANQRAPRRDDSRGRPTGQAGAARTGRASPDEGGTGRIGRHTRTLGARERQGYDPDRNIHDVGVRRRVG